MPAMKITYHLALPVGRHDGRKVRTSATLARDTKEKVNERQKKISSCLSVGLLKLCYHL